MTKSKTVIYNANLITMDNENKVIDNGYLVFVDGLIHALGTGVPEMDEYTDSLDANGGLVTPGLINCHTHAPMSLFRGLGDDEPDRLQRYIFPLEAKYVSPEFVRTGTALSCVEMLLGGTTCFADMYFFEEEVAATASELGIRVLAGQTLMNRTAPDAATIDDAFTRAINFCEDWSLDDLVTPCLAPHAPYSLDTKQLKHVKNVANDLGVKIQMHVAESQFEMQHLQKINQPSSIKYLDSIGLLDNQFLAAHCIHLDRNDIELLAERKCGVSHNPIANTKGAHGTCPLFELLQEEVEVGLGTDSAMSGNSLDLFRQMSLTAPLQRLRKNDRTVLVARDIFRMATIGGAKALGMGEQTGSLEVGKWSDVVIFDAESIRHTPLHDPYATLVYSLQAADVKDVFVGGRRVVEEKKITLADSDLIREQGVNFIAGW